MQSRKRVFKLVAVVLGGWTLVSFLVCALGDIEIQRLLARESGVERPGEYLQVFRKDDVLFLSFRAIRVLGHRHPFGAPSESAPAAWASLNLKDLPWATLESENIGEVSRVLDENLFMYREGPSPATEGEQVSVRQVDVGTDEMCATQMTGQDCSAFHARLSDIAHACAPCLITVDHYGSFVLVLDREGGLRSATLPPPFSTYQRPWIRYIKLPLLPGALIMASALHLGYASH